jgi:hypothetical protein
VTRASWGTRGALFALSVAAAVACQGGYPLSPTVCDEWCDQTQRISCVPYDPAGCVASCEKTGISNPACASLVQQTLQCLRDRPNDTFDCQSAFTALEPCLNLQSEVSACASAFQANPSGGSE